MMAKVSEKASRHPTVPEVMDMETGKIFPVSAIFSKADHTHHQQRMADEMARIRGMTVRYHCPLCHEPLAIRAHLDRTFYFRHPNDPKAQCPYRYEHNLTHDQINAIKYDGARESQRHRQIKQMLENSLNACKDVKPGSVFQEKIIKAWDGDWKRWRIPDVQAEIKGKLFVFEIQLSTTFLTVIAGRREFYQKQGGMLLWIFDEAFLNEEEMRFTERDVFYNNNSNLFYLTAETVQHSKDTGECRIKCRWEVPTLIGEEIKTIWQEKEISLTELTFDQEKQRAYYFDYESEYAKVEKLLQEIKIESESKQKVIAEAEAARKAAFRSAEVELVLALSGQEGEMPYRYFEKTAEQLRVERESAYEKYLREYQEKEETFRVSVIMGYGMPDPLINTAANFERFWIRAGLEEKPEKMQEVVWYHYALALQEKCSKLTFHLSEKLSIEFRNLLNALYSLREGMIIGNRLNNLRALENHIFANYRMFYRYFVFAIRCYGREEETRINEVGSTCHKHIIDYKRHIGQIGYVQNRSVDPLVSLLFSEITGEN
jgi:competence CoiA-like predicted nuclease